MLSGNSQTPTTSTHHAVCHDPDRSPLHRPQVPLRYPSTPPTFFDGLRYPPTTLRHCSTCRTMLGLRSSPGTPRIRGKRIPRCNIIPVSFDFSPLVVLPVFPLVAAVPAAPLHCLWQFSL